MKVKDLLSDERFQCANPEVALEAEIQSGYVGDLLSWVMANAGEGCAWVTIQTHLNIVAVATLLEMACIIVTEGAEIEGDTLAKATEEGIPLLTTEMTAYQVCCLLSQKGVG
ncbi:MAG: AraC family transcriptional regulator [Eubacterium sp.]|nr:AraC family transcriptional regulator [Eubacterium sp.]